MKLNFGRFSTISSVDFDPSFETEENLFNSLTWVIAVIAIGGLAFLKFEFEYYILNIEIVVLILLDTLASPSVLGIGTQL